MTETIDELRQQVADQEQVIRDMMAGRASLSLAYLAERTNRLEKQLAEHGARLGTLETNSDAGKVQAIDDRLSKASEAFTALKERVARLEA